MIATPKKARQRKPKGPFSDELLDQLLAQVSGKDAESLLGESGLIGQLKKQLAERMLAAELSHHLTSEAADSGTGNHRNGSSAKTVITPNGALDLHIPRDRWTPCTPSSTSMRYGSRFVTRARSRTRQSTWRWASMPPAVRTCWGCGSSRPKVPSSGS